MLSAHQTRGWIESRIGVLGSATSILRIQSIVRCSKKLFKINNK